MANEIRVRALSLGGYVEDDPLSSGATTLTSAGLQAVPAIDSTKHLPIILDPDGEDGAPMLAYITAHTAAASTATIVGAQEGTSPREVRKRLPWRHTPTLRDFPRAAILSRKTSGDTTLTTPTANAWADVDSGLDIVLPDCYAGDYVMVGLSFAVDDTAPSVGFDVHSMVGGSAVNSWGYDAAVVEGADATRDGHGAWYCVASDFVNLGGSLQKMLVAGDLSGTNLTLRLRYKPSANTPDRLVFSSLDIPLSWWARNLGPKVVWA